MEWTLNTTHGDGVLRLNLPDEERQHPATERMLMLEAPLGTWTAADLRGAAALRLRVADSLESLRST